MWFLSSDWTRPSHSLSTPSLNLVLLYEFFNFCPELLANRRVTFLEFVKLMGVIIEEQNLQNQVLDAVRVFDDEETGYISVDELKEAFEQMPGRNKVRDFELRDILRKADPNQEGKISTKGGQTPGCLYGSVSVVCPLLLLISTAVCLSLSVSLPVPLSVQSPSLYLLLPGNNLFLFCFF